MKNLIATVILSVFICSCGIQQRFFSARAKAVETKQIINTDTAELNKIITAVIEKVEKEGVDSSINNRFNEIIRKLKKDLEETEKTVHAVDFFLEKNPISAVLIIILKWDYILAN
ncbi:hypothetical protein [Niabella ginsengisoli]|uniref:Uncharacterized protein n=1 Tax=Niabella ginsengisoli TaxID=522298 RepID=A0ABS9SQ43_9BACT|nr:hypothetical protein [Niabella ginsengisoli]MCH5600474.1 hypothetical protein [Niabella ginsengisoli]